MANHFVRYSTKETIHADGIPLLTADDLIEHAWIHAQHASKNEGDRILVNRKTIIHKDEKYIVDYITTQILGVWHQYKVIYLENSSSPLPHTIDFRFETNEALYCVENIQRVPCSSSNFRAAALASMKKNF